MRNLLQLLLALWVTLAISQNKQVIYGMADIPQSLLLNPGGKIPQKKHIGLPFLSQIHLNGGSSGVSVYDIFGTYFRGLEGPQGHAVTNAMRNTCCCYKCIA